MIRSLANFQREFPQIDFRTDYQKYLKYFPNNYYTIKRVNQSESKPPPPPPVTKTVVVNSKKRKNLGPPVVNPPKKMKPMLSSQKRRSSLGSLTKLFKKSKI